MPTRRFEFINGRSYKFWAVTVSDCRVTISFGRIGMDGQSQVKTFHDHDEAARHATKLIAAKTKKGYAEVECGEPATAKSFLAADRTLRTQTELAQGAGHAT